MLQFSHDALLKLQAIDDLLASDHSPNLLQDECVKFFKTFGSHVFKGPINFGGVFISKCFSRGFLQTEKENLIKLQRNALTASASASYFRIGGSVEGGRAKMESSNKASEKKGLSKCINTLTDKVGGPPEVSELQQWKAGLAKSNTTWSVIDRGSSIVPVWDIVEVRNFLKITCSIDIRGSNFLFDTQKPSGQICVFCMTVCSVLYSN